MWPHISPYPDVRVVGRKKKRKPEEATKRKDPTGYAVFFQDSYEAFKKARGVSIDSKQAHLTISRQWRDMGEAEKAAWQYKADQLKQAMSLNGESGAAEMPILPEGIEEDGLPELPMHNPEEDNDEEEEWAPKKPAGRKSLQKVTAIV